ncbi:uncharacterized protein DC041_0007914 [Schistosoma bovis]|uniref:Uncharacterized protein n=1 Tax=Schistosoma bovis TaxID=6184 RepID=A0A430Q2P2_SCHBO|nr:uncharacterized protein DC041_0007914 [Schistosoma bovis]
MMIKNTSVVFIFTTLPLNAHNGMEEKSSYKTYLNRSGDTKDKTVFDNWIEYSENVQHSKAIIVALYGQNYQSAIFFYLLNSPPNESSVASVHKIIIDPVWPAYGGVVIDLHGQGLNTSFKLIFYANCVDVQNCVSYESNFEVM